METSSPMTAYNKEMIKPDSKGTPPRQTAKPAGIHDLMRIVNNSDAMDIKHQLDKQPLTKLMSQTKPTTTGHHQTQKTTYITLKQTSIAQAPYTPLATPQLEMALTKEQSTHTLLP